MRWFVGGLLLLTLALFSASPCGAAPQAVSGPRAVAWAPQLWFEEAYLNLDDPRPCIPEEGERLCSATRARLWAGEAAAWAAQGITDPDVRFTETMLFRARAGDPAVIASIARVLGTPYVKVTRLRFVGDEYVEITNLGGGAQEMRGWTLRSPARHAVYNLPPVLVLHPGQTERFIFPQPDIWPDDFGRVVLFYDALNLPGDDTYYSGSRNDQPPPPNLQGVVVD